MVMCDKNTKKIQKFIKSFNQNGSLVWAQKLIDKFPNAEVYLVGGAVRDILLGLEKEKIKDFDFVVRGLEMEELEFFLGTLGWVEKLGRNFGVLKFKPKDFKNKKDFEPFDIALPRQEISTGTGAYKEFKVIFNSNLEIKKDLLRRDFSINSIAFQILPTPQIIDPFNGIKDLKNKIIKCVGKPEERFSEDYTRLLRGLRFACQLDFELEKETAKSLKKLTPHLNDKNKKGEWIAPREVVAT
jgi:tRNA nucleotidyltransferase (CCA-adding enzyme)